MKATITDRFDVRAGLLGADFGPGTVLILEGENVPAVGTELHVSLRGGGTVVLPILHAKWQCGLYGVFVEQRLGSQTDIGATVQWLEKPADVCTALNA